MQKHIEDDRVCTSIECQPSVVNDDDDEDHYVAAAATAVVLLQDGAPVSISTAGSRLTRQYNSVHNHLCSKELASTVTKVTDCRGS